MKVKMEKGKNKMKLKIEWWKEWWKNGRIGEKNNGTMKGGKKRQTGME